MPMASAQVVLRNVPDTARLALGVAGLVGSDGGAWMIDDAERHARNSTCLVTDLEQHVNDELAQAAFS